MQLKMFILSVFYGIIEGITEWLPISSTGHLILVRHFLPLPVSESFFDLFLVVIQLAAIGAVIIYFRTNLFPPLLGYKKSTGKWSDWRSLWWRIIVATIPAAICGLALDDFIDRHFFTPAMVVCMLIIYGICFILKEIPFSSPTGPAPTSNISVSHISIKNALSIGLFQVLALFPGTSRSGVTMLGGLFIGLPRTTSAEFSFYLALPVMFGASLLKLLKFGLSFSADELFILLAAMLSAFLTSLAVIRWLLGFVRRHSLIPFGIYRILLGILLCFLI